MSLEPALPVTVLGDRRAEDLYRDGAEERLLRLFQSGEDAAEIARILEAPDWTELVHLSPQRHHLLDWFPFRPEGRLLEVGAGCGALTGLFARRVAHVDALEASEVRASVIAHRHRAMGNVRVLVGDLGAMAAGEPYDYVTLVGVLEYAGVFLRGSGDDPARDPYLRLLAQARTQVASEGTLLLAIENQLGLKYLAGHPEDHYGEPLAGVEDYLHDRGVRTFGRTELGDLLAEAGFAVRRWYYPFPDYKFPQAIYSDDQPLGSIEHLGLMYPTPSPLGGQMYFAESRAARVLQRNRLSAFTANSFLAVCGPR